MILMKVLLHTGLTNLVAHHKDLQGRLNTQTHYFRINFGHQALKGHHH